MDRMVISGVTVVIDTDTFQRPNSAGNAVQREAPRLDGRILRKPHFPRDPRDAAPERGLAEALKALSDTKF